MAEQVNEPKYFAYYIPENRPILMNNIIDKLRTEYDVANANSINDQIEANIQSNDWNTVIGENINNHLNSLVLVKFTLVNDIFINNTESDFEKEYKKISENSNHYKVKYSNKDYSQNKLNQILFSGTKQNNYEVNDETQYIFSEIITIPLNSIMNTYVELNFNYNGVNNFDNQLKSYIKKGELNNTLIQNILILTNKILEPVKYSKTYENYRHLQQFIPLLNNEKETLIIKQIWEDNLYKQPEDPYEILQNHKLITNNNIFNIEDDKNRFNVQCRISSKLYVTLTKKFADITYKDALPFKNYFITKETSVTDSQYKYNNIVDKISYIESRISNINKCKSKQTENIKTQNAELIKIMKSEIATYKSSLYNLDPEYKNHILFNTQIGFRLTFSDYLNSHLSLLYLCYVCNNKDRLNRNFLFSYKIMTDIRNDVTFFYINKTLIDDLINSKIKADLFTISRLFKINIIDKYRDDKFKIDNHNVNSSHTLSCDISESNALNKFNKFLEKHISLQLFEYQKNNVLWMLKTEDEVDSDKLLVNSFISDFKINNDNIDDIKIYLYNLRSRCPEAILKNYVITHNEQKSVIDIRSDSSISNFISISSVLNAENYRSNHNYNFDSNIIKNILPYEDYINKYSKPIKLCGGAICDEVGLGKTLSIITHLVVKMKDDTNKYNTYQNKMDILMKKLKNVNTRTQVNIDLDNNTNIDNNVDDLDNTDTDNFDFEDPLENAFEYNNLIIVPSRLTSQWESEIVKYVQTKFNLRAKVLVGISSIKSLEKELRDFYDKQKINKNKKNSKNCKSEKNDKKINIKSKANSNTNSNTNTIIKESIPESTIQNITNANANILPLIQISNKIDIDIDIKINDVGEEDNIDNINNIKLTKEQKMIAKLMKAAKKENDKNLNKKSKNKNIVEKPITKINTFENIINGDNNEEIKEIKEVNSNLQSVDDKYEYVNKYINSEAILGTEQNTNTHIHTQLYDIYIVSINLLSNENYLNYICHNTSNHLKPHTNGESKKECNINKIIKLKTFYSGPSQICRLTDKFNIFKIKWNRVILDEAHENLKPVVKLFSTSIKKYINEISGLRIHSEDQFLYENLCVINSNYKWAMTGTPAQNGIDNIMGLIQFLTKKNYEEPLLTKLDKIRYLSDIVGISKQNMDNLLSNIFKKTLKKDVKTLLNIPLFTEEIIYVEQTNVERNIYNTIRCSRHFTESVRIRRLFLMCTNILINEGYDLDNNNEITHTEVLTLEQLNSNMITKFNQQLKQLYQNQLQIEKLIDSLNLHIKDWEKIYNYVENYINNLPLHNSILPEILQELQDKFADLDRPIVKTQCEIFYNIINAFEIWKNPSTISSIFMDNINLIKEYLFRFWKNHWNSENILYKCAGYGAKYGEIKTRDDIAKKRKQLETIANDNKRINNQISLFSNNEFLKEKTSDPCIICFEPLNNIVVTPCRHIFCLDCTKRMSNDLKANFTCPECRTPIVCNTLSITNVENINSEKKEKDNVEVVEENPINNNQLTDIEKKLGVDWKNKCINKYGSKMYEMVKYLHTIFENKENRVIIFSQYDKMLRMIGQTLEEFKIKFVHCSGNNYVLNRNINKFKTDDSYRVIMISSENSNSGSNLTEANYILMIDVLYDNIDKVKAMESQAIGRSVRLGQKLPVKVVRFVTKGTVEEEHFNKNRYDMSILQN